mgnify:CR=1 FL=1
MSTWLKEKNSDITIKYILFLFSPFFSFIYALRRINTKSSYLTFFATAIFFGMSYTVPSGKSSEGGIDGQVYREFFENYKYVQYSEFIDNLMGFLSFNVGMKDYYFNTIAFYLSRVTDNYHVMFMVFAIIFAYFSLKTLKFLTEEDKFDLSIISYILLYLFLHNQIFNINGVRFWTPAWIALYSIFQIYRNNNNKYFLLALLTPYFHGSYWIFIAVLILARFLMRFEKIWIIFFITSYFISIFSLALIEYVQPYLPNFLVNLTNSYTSTEAISRRENITIYKTIFSNLTTFYINFIIILFIKNSKEIRKNIKTKNLYLFLLVWSSTFNFFMAIPSLGNRFIELSYPIIAYIWLINFKNKKYDYVILALPLVFANSIREQIIYYNMTLSTGFYFSSPFYLIYKHILSL